MVYRVMWAWLDGSADCRKAPISPRSEIHFYGLCKSVVWFFNIFSTETGVVLQA